MTTFSLASFFFPFFFFFLNPRETHRSVFKKKLLLLATVSTPYIYIYIYIYISVGSGDFGFGVSILLASPHRHQTAFRLPLASLGSVGRSFQRCGYVDAGRSCRLRYWFAQSYSYAIFFCYVHYVYCTFFFPLGTMCIGLEPTVNF